MKRTNKLMRWATGIALGAVALGAGALSYTPNSERPVEVKVGKIGYSRGPLVSHDFANCSAVILDFGDEALMAHVIPVDTLAYGWTGPSDHYVGYADFMGELTKEAQIRNLNMKRVEAIVSFGRESPKERILESLLKKGIKIREIEDSHLNEIRSVLYDPKPNRLRVANSDSPEMQKLRNPAKDTSWEGP